MLTLVKLGLKILIRALGSSHIPKLLKSYARSLRKVHKIKKIKNPQHFFILTKSLTKEQIKVIVKDMIMREFSFTKLFFGEKEKVIQKMIDFFSKDKVKKEMKKNDGWRFIKETNDIWKIIKDHELQFGHKLTKLLWKTTRINIFADIDKLYKQSLREMIQDLKQEMKEQQKARDKQKKEDMELFRQYYRNKRDLYRQQKVFNTSAYESRGSSKENFWNNYHQFREQLSPKDKEYMDEIVLGTKPIYEDINRNVSFNVDEDYGASYQYFDSDSIAYVSFIPYNQILAVSQGYDKGVYGVKQSIKTKKRDLGTLIVRFSKYRVNYLWTNVRYSTFLDIIEMKNCDSIGTSFWLNFYGKNRKNELHITSLSKYYKKEYGFSVKAREEWKASQKREKQLSSQLQVSFKKQNKPMKIHQQKLDTINRNKNKKNIERWDRKQTKQHNKDHYSFGRPLGSKNKKKK